MTRFYFIALFEKLMYCIRLPLRADSYLQSIVLNYVSDYSKLHHWEQNLFKASQIEAQRSH